MGFFRTEIAPSLRLLLTIGIGSQSAAVLLREFGHASKIFSAPPDILNKLIGVTKTLAWLRGSENWRREQERAFAWLTSEVADTSLDQQVARAIWTWSDPQYPPALLEIADPPLVLFVQGSPL